MKYFKMKLNWWEKQGCHQGGTREGKGHPLNFVGHPTIPSIIFSGTFQPDGHSSFCWVCAFLKFLYQFEISRTS